MCTNIWKKIFFFSKNILVCYLLPLNLCLRIKSMNISFYLRTAAMKGNRKVELCTCALLYYMNNISIKADFNNQCTFISTQHESIIYKKIQQRGCEILQRYMNVSWERTRKYIKTIDWFDWNIVETHYAMNYLEFQFEWPIFGMFCIANF